MVVGDLVEYLREHLALGYDIHELKLQLLRYGHSPKTVEEAMEVIKSDALGGLPQPPLPSHVSSSAHIWLVLPAVLFVMLFSIAVVLALLRNPVL